MPRRKSPAAPFHQQVKAFLFNGGKTQPLKKPQRWATAFNKDSDRLTRIPGFRHDLAQQIRTGAVISVLREQDNIKDVKSIAAAVQVQPAHRYTFAADHHVRSTGILDSIVAFLRPPLH